MNKIWWLELDDGTKIPMINNETKFKRHEELWRRHQEKKN